MDLKRHTAQKNYFVSKVSLRRQVFMFCAAAGAIVGALSTWLDWRSGLISSIPQDITLALVLMPLFLWARKAADPTSPARVGMLIFALSFIPSIPNELIHMPIFLLWLPAVSLLAFYFFGFREGVIWAACFLVVVLTESLWVLSSTQDFQFQAMAVMAIIIYLFLSVTAAAFQYLLESYEQQILLESEERQIVSERMAEMQKLETIGVLAGGIAHDFNNLLVGVMGNAELAMLEEPHDGKQQYHLGQVVKSAHRGADLVRQMLAYSGQGQISMGQQNFNDLIRDVAELLSTVVGKQIRLNQFLMNDLPDIYGDKNQLTQLIMNLITNAAEAMQGKSGEILLRTDVCQLSRQDIASMYMPDHVKEGEFILIEVNDSGCGMSAQTQARIFDPFFTTKDTGTGLGLAALLGIVRSHGGTLSLKSELNKGSCFSIYFPQLADSQQAGSQKIDDQKSEYPEVSGDFMAKSDLHGVVLVVDDEDAVRDVARRMLENEGIQVMTARNGVEAVSTFRKHANKISLVLMDLTMPEMDGEQAFHAIQTIKKDATIILSSGFPESKAAERLRCFGLAGFVCKPYTRSVLLNEISRLSPAGMPAQGLDS